ncbi:hypothetical protein RRG08_010792 [Elysia crispata]|uniref:Uncharacterized protein n=1 Tax=Elysia crispata TaxID=231223 RepID=A0AAE1ALM9_9GAST|nr:hypothetical protein RRG08_010792 [Elysia crispata]
MSKKGQRAGLRLRSGENESALGSNVTKRRRTMDSTHSNDEESEGIQVTRQQNYRIQVGCAIHLPSFSLAHLTMA